MKFYIPACGDRLILTKDWEFDLYLEYRNMGFAKLHKLIDQKTASYGCYDANHNLKKVRATIEKGLTLEVARVYVRQFSKSAIQVGDDYDSITFRVLKGEKSVKGARFWSKLPDTYSIEYKQEMDSLYRDRVKAVKEVMER